MMDSKKPLLLRPPKQPSPLSTLSFTVTRGFDTSSKKLISMWQYSLTPNDGTPSGVLREIYHRKRLRSDGVLAVYDVVITDRAIFIVSEDLGATLRDVIDTHSSLLTWHYIRKLSTGLLTALDIIHHKGVIHAGLSPDCVHISEGGDVKISQFYFASTGKDAHIGPFSNYAPPEALKEEYVPTQAFDLWSVACILLESVAHRPVFAANNHSALSNLLETEIKPLNATSAQALLQRFVPSAPPLFLDLICRLMQWDSKDRLPANEALKHSFLVECSHIIVLLEA